MKLLAIDPSSTEMGVYDGVTPQTWKFEGDRKARLHALLQAVALKLRAEGPYDFIVFETPFARGRDATRCLFGAAGIIEAVADMNGVGTIDIDNGTLRKWATGTGKKKAKNKADAENPMFERARSFVPPVFWDTMTDHEADAICLYYYILEKGIVEHGN